MSISSQEVTKHFSKKDAQGICQITDKKCPHFLGATAQYRPDDRFVTVSITTKGLVTSCAECPLPRLSPLFVKK